MVTVKSIDVLSAAKIMGAFYAILAFVAGVLIALLSLIGMAVGGGQGGPGPMIFGGGVALIFPIILPIFYGIAGFIGGIITAALYNLVAMLVGGVEIELSGLKRRRRENEPPY